jgi:hypothetical protein
MSPVAVAEPITDDVVMLAQKNARDDSRAAGGYDGARVCHGLTVQADAGSGIIPRAWAHEFQSLHRLERLSMRRSQVYSWIGLHETFCERLRIENVRVTLADIDPAKLGIYQADAESGVVAGLGALRAVDVAERSAAADRGDESEGRIDAVHVGDRARRSDHR